MDKAGTAKRTHEILLREGALIEGHFVYTAEDHGPLYVAKDKVYANPNAVNEITQMMADAISDNLVQEEIVIVGPVIGGVNLSQGVARHLTHDQQLFRTAGEIVRAVFAEREERRLAKYGDGQSVVIGGSEVELPEGSELVVKYPTFALKRGYENIVRGRKVVVVEDILNTGISAARTVAAVRAAGGEPVLAVAICNRGKVTAEKIGVPELISLLDLDLEAWPKKTCLLCQDDIPINTDFGHGKAFLERRSAQ